MTDFVKSYFFMPPQGTHAMRFYRAMAIDDAPSQTFEDWLKICPTLPKGWFELTHLPMQDRLEFLGDYWRAILPFHPLFTPFIEEFFASLESITVYLVQRSKTEALEPLLIYARKQGGGFFQGFAPAAEEEIVQLVEQFSDIVLPADYIAFMRVHNGFAKCDDTGIFATHKILPMYQLFQENLLTHPPLHDAGGRVVEERALIPFYQSYAFPCYQCFWAQWHPREEMGNLYYSGLTHTLTNHRAGDNSPENQAFPTFLEWLQFYLESIEEI